MGKKRQEDVIFFMFKEYLVYGLCMQDHWLIYDQSVGVW